MTEVPKEPPALRPVADTISGSDAAADPAGALAHYERLSSYLWLSPTLTSFADRHLELVAAGRPAWGSVAAPYGFGKTAASICLWRHARENDFLAIPPLSCTSYEELATGIAALASAQVPALKRDLRRLLSDISRAELEGMARADADRYELPPAVLRRLLRDKAQAGQLVFEGSSHRFVNFLSRLGELAARHCRGLVIIVDELQQLLGPLDAQTIGRFREFIWGMRTEQARCGVVLALDELLERRLQVWADDILHRVRETGPTLRLTQIYTREFPGWLWSKLTAATGDRQTAMAAGTIDPDVLLALGQLVERSDLANGPRTVVDVFQRAAQRRAADGVRYGLGDFVADVHDGRFRYFGEGRIQSVLVRLLADEWIASDEARRRAVQTFSVFPLGCPPEVLGRVLPDAGAMNQAVAELFGPLLVNLSEGLALEALQQVRRPTTDWEAILRRSWERLPAFDTLAAHAPQHVLRTLVPRLFPTGNPAAPDWTLISEAATAITGWRYYRGSFDTAYPARIVALYLGEKEPPLWPSDADLLFALVCERGLDRTVQPSVETRDDPRCFLLRLPVLRPIERPVPAELARFGKFIEPEPFRPAMILDALHDLRALAAPNRQDAEVTGGDENWNSASLRQMDAFVAASTDFLARELLEGKVNVGMGRSMVFRGPELLQTLFSTACRQIFPEYKTLIHGPKWRDLLVVYQEALRAPACSPAQRQGREEFKSSKAELHLTLFQQKSTAAGDSLLRTYGPLVHSSGDAQDFTLRLAMHPAETALWEHLRGLPRNRHLSMPAAKEFLRHRGYVEEETIEVVELLSARELITFDPARGLSLLRKGESASDSLTARVAALRADLLALGVEIPADALPLPGIQKAAKLEKRLDERKGEIADEARSGVDRLLAFIGEVVASEPLSEWSTSGLSPHLAGIAAILIRTKSDLVQGLRKELQRVEGEQENLARCKPPAFAAWVKRRGVSLSTWEEMGERTAQFIKRNRALAAWIPANEQLRATSALCAKVRATDPAPGLTLERVLKNYRERFAVEDWEPVFGAEDFLRDLRKVQADVQTLLFAFAQAFYRERDSLLLHFPYLSLREAPEFASDVSSSEREPFRALYRWAGEHIRIRLNRCSMRREGSTPWRDPHGRLSWKELFNKADGLLRNTADYKMTLAAGATVERLHGGFRSAGTSPIQYADPMQPPDFRDLEEKFRQGHIIICIDPQEN